MICVKSWLTRCEGTGSKSAPHLLVKVGMSLVDAVQLSLDRVLDVLLRRLNASFMHCIHAIVLD